MATSSSKTRGTTAATGGEGQVGAIAGSIWEAPKGAGWETLAEATAGDDTWSIIDWGLEGGGKTAWPLRYMPLPIMLLNLDRPVTKAHMGWPGMKERAPGIFIKNFRESVDAINEMEATMIKSGIEEAIKGNQKWLKGGTVIIDGGTMLRDVLKLADPTIGPKVASGKKFNPKDKAQVNAYVAAFMSHLQDQGINLVITAHAAFSWAMETTKGDDGEMKKSLMRTKNLYPKLDDIAFERSNLNLLLFKRCECGKTITNQDGTCVAQGEAINDRPNAARGHEGRKHCVRIVVNKFNTATEGTEWQDFDMDTLKTLCTNPRKAQLLMDERDG